MDIRYQCYYVIIKRKKLLEHLTEKEMQKTNKKKISIEKVIKRKGGKLYVKQKGYNTSFSSCIDKKDIV